MDERAVGLATPEVVALCGVPASTLSNWITKGLCRPSLVDSDGRQRATRYWSVRDVVIVRTIRTLRQAGCPLPVLERAASILATTWQRGLNDVILWWDGADVLTLTPAGEVISLVTRHGQGVFSLTEVVNVSCPVGTWERELLKSLDEREPVPVAEIRHRRELARRRREAPTWPLGHQADTGTDNS